MGAFAGSVGGYFTLHQDVSEIAVNTSANTSTVRCHMYITCSSTGTGVYNLGAGPNWSANVNGNTASGTFTYDERGNANTIDLGTYDTTVGHDANGNATISYSGSADMSDSPYVTTANTSGSLALTHINRYANITSFTFPQTTDEWIEFQWAADQGCDFFTWFSNAYDGGGHHDTPTSGSGPWTIDLHNLKSNATYDITVGVREAASSLWTFSSTQNITTKTQSNYTRGRIL